MKWIKADDERLSNVSLLLCIKDICCFDVRGFHSISGK